MAFLFRGQGEYSVDDRGRTLVPPSYKPALSEIVVMGIGSMGQLWVYPKPTFDAILQAVQDIPAEEQGPEYDEALGHLLAGQEVDFDKQGRLSIPPFLRRQAGITDTLIVRGNGDRVEFWQPERLISRTEAWQANGGEGAYTTLRKAGFRS
jgi:MraZ protein